MIADRCSTVFASNSLPTSGMVSFVFSVGAVQKGQFFDMSMKGAPETCHFSHFTFSVDLRKSE